MPVRKTFYTNTVEGFKRVSEEFDSKDFIDTKIKVSMSEEKFKALKKTPIYKKMSKTVKIAWNNPKHNLKRMMKQYGLKKNSGIRDLVVSRLPSNLLPLFEEIEKQI